jgi:hypothetical protein
VILHFYSLQKSFPLQLRKVELPCRSGRSKTNFFEDCKNAKSLFIFGISAFELAAKKRMVTKGKFIPPLFRAI